MPNHRRNPGRIWIAGLLLSLIPLESGMFQNLPRFLGFLCKLPDVEEGCSEMEDDH